jgi:predicted oxidoreductase
MERVEVAPGLSFSRIVYGMWRLGDDPDTSPAHVRAKVEACLEQGITTMDQADIYGGFMAEEILGRALREAPELRDRIEIVTKCGILIDAGRYAGTRVKHYDTGRAHVLASVDHSLRLMGVERIDLLLIHRPDPLMDHRQTGAALDEVVRSGKVRAVGVSNFMPWDFSLLQSAMETPLATNQIELSLQAHEGFTDGQVAFLQERGLPVMAWSPLGGGRLVEGDGPVAALLRRIGDATGTDAAAVAVAWLLTHPARILPILGTNDLGHLRGIARAVGVPMDRQTWFELYAAAIGQEVP